MQQKSQQVNSYPVNGVNGGLQFNGILPKKRQRATPTYAGKGISFDQESCNNDISKMVILHDYPLDIVEQPGFVVFAQTLQPQFNPLRLNSFEGCCVSMYLREKQKLLDLINKMPGRINLTLDVWSSNQTTGVGYLPLHSISLSQERPSSRLAVDALQTMSETISKVRECMKFVKYSESHEEKFIELKQQLRVPSLVNLLIDDNYKWDTTYHMLVAAWELKEVFACLDTPCPDFTTTLTMDYWKQIKTLCSYLKHLYDATHILTTRSYPTANLFFAEVSKLHMELTIAAFSQDLFRSSLILPLLQNFDQYWRDICLIFAVAVAMDPRHKMKLAETTFSKIFGENAEPWIRIVEDGFHELFIEYNTEMLHFAATNGGKDDKSMLGQMYHRVDAIDMSGKH